MKVLHLPIILCNQPSEIVRFLNKIGIPADYMVLDDAGQEWLLTHNNIRYNLYANSLAKGDPDLRELKKAVSEFLLAAIPKYDIFHFHSNISLFSQWFGNFDDLKILKKAGKKIVVSYWGCDIRKPSLNLKYKYNSCEACAVKCNDFEKSRKVDEFAKYADLKLVHLRELVEHAPKGSVFIPAPIETNFWRSRGPKTSSKTIKILHSFGNRNARGDVKGSLAIENAIVGLKKKGYKIESVFCDKIPSRNLREVYEKIDLLVEQLKYGIYGLTALEAMSMGKPVVGFIREPYRKYFKNELPIVDANPENIESVLEGLIKNPAQLKQIGEKSREFVKKYHDSDKIVRQLASYYQTLNKDQKKLIVDQKEVKRQIRKDLGIKTLLLVSNDLVHDPRVQREADCLSQAGYQTITLGYTKDKNFRYLDRKNYQRLIVNPLKGEDSGNPSFSSRAAIPENVPPKDTFKKRVAKIKIVKFIYYKVFAKTLNYYYCLEHFIKMSYLLWRKGLTIRPDIVYANDVDTLLPAYLIKKFVGSKLIYDAHEIWTEMGLTLPKIVIFGYERVERFLIRRVDAFISVNQSLINYLSRKHRVDFKKKKIIVVPVYNVPKFEKISNRKTSRPPLVLYQGRFEPKRGLEEFIVAADKIKNARIIIRGYGSNQKELVRLARISRNSNLEFAKPVKMENMVQAASAADIGVLPYLADNINNRLCLPNKLFEYMMAGLAVACSDLPELRKIIKKYRNGVLFDPYKPESIAKAINYLISHPSQLSRMKKNSLLAAEELNWEKEQEKIIDVYEKIFV